MRQTVNKIVMKLAHIFTLVLGVHAVIIAAVLVQGCASESEPTNPTAAAPTGEPERVQEQPYRPAGSATRPSSAAPQTAGQTRYPPTRPDWNISDDSSPAVVVPPSPQPVNPQPSTEVYVAEDLPSGDVEDSSVAGYNRIRSGQQSQPSTGPTPTTPASSSAGKTYIVKKGDVLSKVARRHGVTLGEVMALNGFTREEANQLKIGQAILIPAASDSEPETPVNTPAPTYTSARVDVDGETYTVQSGDNLSAIAKRFDSSVSAIKSANGLSSDRIVVGQELLVPKVEREPEPVVGVPNDSGEVIYVVKPGDTLGAIANRYGVTVKTIMQANGISDPRRLRAEQKLVIPTGLEPVQDTAPSAPAAPAAPSSTVRIAPPSAPAAPSSSTTVEEDEFSFEDLENAPTVNVPN